MTTLLFPGQGSQKKGMGGYLFDEYKDITAQADKILGYSIKKLCLQDPDNILNQTKYAQPALYVVNTLFYFKLLTITEKKIDYVAGHGLGEFNALLAAGAFNFEIGLSIVQKRGELMSAATGGGMAAVVGLSPDKIEAVIRSHGLATISIANYNSPSQIVISGSRADIEAAGPVFEKSGAKLFLPFVVGGAFHSPHMNSACKKFERLISTYPFADLSVPVVSNVSAKPHVKERLIQNLARHLANPVRWMESIRYIIGMGENEFIEVGPGDVLAKLFEELHAKAVCLNVADIIGVERRENPSIQIYEEKKVESGFTGMDGGSRRQGLEALIENEKRFKLKYKNDELIHVNDYYREVMSHYKTLSDVFKIRGSDDDKGITFITMNLKNFAIVEESIPYSQIFKLSLQALGALQQRGLNPGNQVLFLVFEQKDFIIFF
jgi:trans-AT polyketide synthase/acyltransferase/oxidoreductase domain-containing protein